MTVTKRDLIVAVIAGLIVLAAQAVGGAIRSSVVLKRHLENARKHTDAKQFGLERSQNFITGRNVC